MVAEPAPTPNTVPVELTDAMAALVVVHAPPETPLVSTVVPPTQVVAVPVIVPADGGPITVIGKVATPVPQLRVTV